MVGHVQKCARRSVHQPNGTHSLTTVRVSGRGVYVHSFRVTTHPTRTRTASTSRSLIAAAYQPNQ